MARIKPLTVMNCILTYADEITFDGGGIVACTRCRGIGFFDIKGTMTKTGVYWIAQKSARLEHEGHAKRNHTFPHHCMKDTMHPINKKVSLR